LLPSLSRRGCSGPGRTAGCMPPSFTSTEPGRNNVCCEALNGFCRLGHCGWDQECGSQAGSVRPAALLASAVLRDLAAACPELHAPQSECLLAALSAFMLSTRDRVRCNIEAQLMQSAGTVNNEHACVVDEGLCGVHCALHHVVEAPDHGWKPDVSRNSSSEHAPCSPCCEIVCNCSSWLSDHYSVRWCTACARGSAVAFSNGDVSWHTLAHAVLRLGCGSIIVVQQLGFVCSGIKHWQAPTSTAQQLPHGEYSMVGGWLLGESGHCRLGRVCGQQC
jgi:hypothetical protein